MDCYRLKQTLLPFSRLPSFDLVVKLKYFSTEHSPPKKKEICVGFFDVKANPPLFRLLLLPPVSERNTSSSFLVKEEGWLLPPLPLFPAPNEAALTAHTHSFPELKSPSFLFLFLQYLLRFPSYPYGYHLLFPSLIHLERFIDGILREKEGKSISVF